MQFTRLRMQGFKSFVDPTEVAISRGLTGVVGPNGCGKSNLVEALRWVMGETSAKSLRGGGMDDVIFAGAASRPARSFAEVALHVDNEQRLAPAEFNKDDQLEIVRRITRDVGSAFRFNGRDVRARDIRMLFADASTGAHSPALVGQGRIAELINSKPKARRAVLEEAAGIGGLYQRRHEAELKLRAAEDNLSRVSDVLEALDAQLAQLARQARQAARYREIAADLRRAEGLLLWLRWRDAEAERAAAETALREATVQAARMEGEASALARARAEAEDALGPLREEDAVAAAVMQRAVVERERIEERRRQAAAEVARLEARAEQLAADLERESTLARDADDNVAGLDAEAGQLTEAQEGQELQLAELDEAARAAAAKVEMEEAELDRLVGDAARLAARRQAGDRRLAEAERVAEKAAADRQKGETESRSLSLAIEEAEKTLASAAAASEDARSRADAAEARLATCEADRAAAQDVEAERRAASSAAAGEASAVRAEADALEKLLARDAGGSGNLLDALSVTPGYEAALGAALGDDLRAPEVGEDGGAGWRRLDDYGDAEDLPQGVDEVLADRVDGPDALARRLGRIGVVEADAGAAMQASLRPGQRLVSREGDLWRWDGYLAGAGDAPSAAALRLQQRNRLSSLQSTLTQAEAAAASARADHDDARARLTAATEADATARSTRKAAEAAASEAQSTLGRAEADLNMRRSRHEALVESVRGRKEAEQAAREETEAARSALAELGDVSDARDAAEAAKLRTAAARAEMLEARGAADEARREGEARAKRLAEIAKTRAAWVRRKDTAGGRTADLSARVSETASALKEATAAPEELEAQAQAAAEAVERAEVRARAAADAVAEGESAKRAAETAEREAARLASEAREDRARREAVAEAAVARVEDAEARIREEAESSPQKLLETLEIDPDAAPGADRTELLIVDLRRKRDGLGAVNLRAEEDAAEVSAERDDLAAEKDDLEAAIAKLRQGIGSLNSEGRKRLLAAFDEVNENFSVLFTRLFGGGTAKLVLVESEDPLDAGLEIMCMPPGKKLSTLSLLSGGEQTLAAMSLIFAVFLANPAPICVLDEVDAPLDDANVTRFCDLLDEMTQRTDTRFIIVTHHAVTMARMDRLYGVTMAEQGVSQLVSVDLERAAEMVEA